MPLRPPAPSRAGIVCAWLGGAVFVASLSSFVFFYARAAGTAQHGSPARVISTVAWNVALFTAFAAHHSLLARTGPKRWLTRFVSSSLERTTYVWIASVLFFLACALWTPVPAPDLYRTTGGAAWLHRALQALGVALIARSASVLDVLDLAGIRQAQGTNTAPDFRVAGPYRWVRHPLYLGWVLIVFGAAQMTADRFTFAVVSTIYILLAIPWEERSLKDAFGEQYEAYRRRVRWRLVPYVY